MKKLYSPDGSKTYIDPDQVKIFRDAGYTDEPKPRSVKPAAVAKKVAPVKTVNKPAQPKQF